MAIITIPQGGGLSIRRWNDTIEVTRVAAVVFLMIKIEFLRQVKAEVAKVKWPTKDELVRLSTLVIGASIAMAVIIGVLDLAFVNLVDFLVTN